MIVKKFTLGPIENNNYLLIDETSKEAVLIDCTEFNDEIENNVKNANAELKYILLTHAHFDHILGINDFKKRNPECKALLHKADKELLDGIEDFAARFGAGKVEVQKTDGFVEENDTIKFGSNEIKVIHTPGHTKGGVCYLVGDKIFTGDTLFYESVGRTDLPGGDFKELKSSIENKLFTLDDNIKVYPGHGCETTIEHEKNNNNFM